MLQRSCYLGESACSVYSEIIDDIELKRSLPLVFTHMRLSHVPRNKA